MPTFGVERERFIVDSRGMVVPMIGNLLPLVHEIGERDGLSQERFSFELFSGQIEDRTPPCGDLDKVQKALWENGQVLCEAADLLGLSFDHSEYVEESQVTSFEVNPFSERHREIWDSIPKKRKISASVVAAVHVHISVTQDEAVQVLNFCRQNVIDRLVALGDHSGLRRIKAYQAMAETEGVPPEFSSFSELEAYISGKGGEKNVWDLVRYKPSTKTIEFRMFGATEDDVEVRGYVQSCYEIVCAGLETKGV